MTMVVSNGKKEVEAKAHASMDPIAVEPDILYQGLYTLPLP